MAPVLVRALLRVGLSGFAQATDLVTLGILCEDWFFVAFPTNGTKLLLLKIQQLEFLEVGYPWMLMVSGYGRGLVNELGYASKGLLPECFF